MHSRNSPSCTFKRGYSSNTFDGKEIPGAFIPPIQLEVSNAFWTCGYPQLRIEKSDGLFLMRYSTIGHIAVGRQLEGMSDEEKCDPIGQPKYVCMRSKYYAPHTDLHLLCVTTDSAGYTSRAPSLVWPFHIVRFLCGHSEPRLPACRRYARTIAFVRARRVRGGRSVGQRSGPFAVLCRNVQKETTTRLKNVPPLRRTNWRRRSSEKSAW
jgi:hypothetical protein